MRPFVIGAVAGAVAGSLATVPMTATMVALHRRLPRDQQYALPPREITQDILERTAPKARLTQRQLRYSSLLAHFAFGAATGAAYGAMTRGKSGCAVRHTMQGSGYGMAVWAASYLGWIPAAKILYPADRHPPRRRRMMIAAHLVWGAALGWCTRSLLAVSRHGRS